MYFTSSLNRCVNNDSHSILTVKLNVNSKGPEFDKRYRHKLFGARVKLQVYLHTMKDNGKPSLVHPAKKKNPSGHRSSPGSEQRKLSISTTKI